MWRRWTPFERGAGSASSAPPRALVQRVGLPARRAGSRRRIERVAAAWSSSASTFAPVPQSGGLEPRPADLDGCRARGGARGSVLVPTTLPSLRRTVDEAGAPCRRRPFGERLRDVARASSGTRLRLDDAEPAPRSADRARRAERPGSCSGAKRLEADDALPRGSVPSRLATRTRQARLRAVPIYEYACMECESHFDELVRSSEQAVRARSAARRTSSSSCRSFAVHGASCRSRASRADRRRRRVLRRLLRLRLR